MNSAWLWYTITWLHKLLKSLLPFQNTASWLVNSMVLISVKPRWCFWQCRLWADLVMVQAETGFGCWWAALVLDRARDEARAKDRAVARAWFLTQTHHLLVPKLHLDHPHRHQMPNQTVCHTINSSCNLIGWHDCWAFCLQKCLLQGNLVTRR